GKVFGYDNRDVPSPDGHRLHVVREVNQGEAAVVRQIFEMYACGLGFTRIAKRLNTESVAPPRQSTRGWFPCAIREILRRQLYNCLIIYGQLQKIIRGGKKKRRRRDEKDWIKVDVPHLRIIEPDLWKAVQDRFAYRKNQNRQWVRDIESPYLLTGFCRCSV